MKKTPKRTKTLLHLEGKTLVRLVNVVINKTPKLVHLLPGKSLAKLPVAGSDIVGSYSFPITGGDLEGEALPIKITVALPILAPVAGHWLPASLGAFDRNSLNVACSTNVGD